jgi:hypothetical protein
MDSTSLVDLENKLKFYKKNEEKLEEEALVIELVIPCLNVDNKVSKASQRES